MSDDDAREAHDDELADWLDEERQGLHEPITPLRRERGAGVMSTTTHTPGPWFVDRWALGWFVHNGDDPGDRGQRKTIAECREADLGGPFERHHAEANARLIAAAPETAAERDRLREALERIAHLDETEGAGDLSAAMMIARAALGQYP